MPNTPAQIGKGITVWTAASAVSPAQIDIAQQILSALGEEIFLEEEEFLNMATALSGTGPAYVFLFMEAMVDAGVHLGFPRRVAEQLVAENRPWIGRLLFSDNRPGPPGQAAKPGHLTRRNFCGCVVLLRKSRIQDCHIPGDMGSI